MKITYDIVMGDDGFKLFANDKPLITPFGNEVSHNNARLLRLAITHEIFHPNQKISPLNLLIKITDVVARSSEILNFDLDEKINNDPLLFKGNSSITNPLEEMLINNSRLFDFMFLNSSSLASSLNHFLLRKEENQSTTGFIIENIKDLSLEQQLVFDSLIQENGCGLLIHYLLVKGFITFSEYASGILILKLKNNDIETIDLMKSKGEGGMADMQLQLSSMAMVALDFVTLCKSENRTSVIEEIIKRGEDNQTEFKSTLRWDIRQAKKNPAIEHASLKTICAFLNSEGGDLLIGVRDDGSIEGIETDIFDNDDRFLLHIWTLIKTCMGQEVVEWVKTSLQKFGNKTVCRVNCRKSAKPVFLKQNGFDEAFYVRVGPSSSSLDISSALKYIEQHF